MLKEKIKESILEILTNVGYPKITPKDVFNHLPKIWETLKDKSLIPDGMQYQDLLNICVTEHNNAHMENEFETMMAQQKKPPVVVKCTVEDVK